MENSNREGFFRTGKVSSKIVAVLVIIFLIVTSGIVTFAQSVATDLFQTNTTNNADWNISFTKVIQNKITGNAKEIEPVRYDNTMASFVVELTGIGDSISYDFIITNNGRLDAKVDGIFIYPANTEEDALFFYTSNLKAGDELLAGESKELNVSVNFNQNYKGDASKLEKSVKIFVNFVQK